jgi:hypothetical protein
MNYDVRCDDNYVAAMSCDVTAIVIPLAASLSAMPARV